MGTLYVVKSHLSHHYFQRGFFFYKQKIKLEFFAYTNLVHTRNGDMHMFFLSYMNIILQIYKSEFML